MPKEYGLLVSPQGQRAERMWFPDRKSRDAAYKRLKKQAGPGKRYVYVKKMERGG